MLTPKFVTFSEIVFSKIIWVRSWINEKFITCTTLVSGLSTYEHYTCELKSLLKTQQLQALCITINGEKYFHICISYQTETQK